MITLKPTSFCLHLSLYIDHNEKFQQLFLSSTAQTFFCLVLSKTPHTHIQRVEFYFCRLERSGNGSNFSENIVFNFESQRSVVRTIGLSDGGGLLRWMVGTGPISPWFREYWLQERFQDPQNDPFFPDIHDPVLPDDIDALFDDYYVDQRKLKDWVHFDKVFIQSFLFVV